MPAFTVRLLAWSEALTAARAVREAVFIVEQRVPRELEWDEWDALSDHAIALDERGAPIGTARLLPDARIGRMAVLAAWRRRGVGGAMLSLLLERALARGMTGITLHAQTHAAPFYRRYGFSERGGEFSEADIPHVEMTLELRARSGS